MTQLAYYRYFTQQVAEWYPAGEAEAITRILWEDLAGTGRTALLRNAAMSVDPALRRKMDAALSRLKKQEPVQYITGSSVFMGLRIQVNPEVLIPRPETEELVQWIRDDYPQQPASFSLMDIGTGSGCIAIALKHFFRNATVTAVDASPGALKVAAENARRHATTIDFRQLNFLNPGESNTLPQVHLIVSNPPYIPQQEHSLLDAHVTRYEPAAALFVPDEDPLLFYRALAAFAGTHLLPNGRLYVETHERYARETAALFSDTFRVVEIKTDLNGRERMVRAFNS